MCGTPVDIVRNWAKYIMKYETYLLEVSLLFSPFRLSDLRFQSEPPSLSPLTRCTSSIPTFSAPPHSVFISSFLQALFYHFIPIPKQPVARRHMGSIQLKLTSTTPIIQQVSTCSSWTGRDMITHPLHSSIHPSLFLSSSPQQYPFTLTQSVHPSSLARMLHSFLPSFLHLSPLPHSASSDLAWDLQHISLTTTLTWRKQCPQKFFCHFHVIIMTLSSGSVDVCWCLHRLYNNKTALTLRRRPWAGDHCRSPVQQMLWLKIEMLNERYKPLNHFFSSN